MRQVRFVVVPSGNTSNCGQSLFRFVLFLISSIVKCLFLESTLFTSIGWNAFIIRPSINNFEFSVRETKLGRPRIMNKKVSKNVECGPAAKIGAFFKDNETNLRIT